MKKFYISLALLLFTLFLNASFVLAAIDINTASLSELDKIPEVGPVIAQRIIDYRNTNGPFKTIEEIKNVKGIGDATFLKMKDQITVGTNSSNSTNENTSTDFDVKSTSEESDNNINSYNSSHSSQTGLSDFVENLPKIGAGRKRLATVRTPINFSAYQNKKGELAGNFTWSFGDGTSAGGEKVSHAYQFPGTYNVVLNAHYNNQESVSRTTVVVTEPKIKINSINSESGFLEIRNDSDKEQNLNDWLLQNSSSTYKFPVDTIINANSAVKIPLKLTGFNLGSFDKVTLAYPDGGIVDEVGFGVSGNVQKISEIKKKLQELRKQVSVKEMSFENKLRGETSKLAEKPKNVIVLRKEASLIERIKNAIF